VSHIHFVGGEKGGVGKSVVARLLAQWFVDKSIPFAAIDGDPTNGSLTRFYREFTQQIDLSRPESADEIVDRALGAERQVLVDLPAQSAKQLWAWFAGANVLGFAREMGIGVTFWHVSDGGYASVTEIERGLTLFADRVQHVVVKNYGRSKDFTQLDESAARQKLDELSGKVLELPELETSAMYKIDRAGVSFWAAVNHSEGDTALKPLERQRVKLWLERSFEQLAAFQGTI
jgi:hypothetical protein